MSTRNEVVIVPYQDGPYLVRGPVVVRDQDGHAIELSRSPVALCRCGKSQMRPFCDGTHQLIRFQAPSEPEGPERHPDRASKPRGSRGAGGRSTPATASPADPAVGPAVQAALEALRSVSAADNEQVREAVAALQRAAHELRARP